MGRYEKWKRGIWMERLRQYQVGRVQEIVENLDSEALKNQQEYSRLRENGSG